MGTFNQVLLLANLTRDPASKTLPGGTVVCEIGLATNRKYEVQGEKREEVMFIDAAAFGRQGELIAQHFQKGDPIFVAARLKLDTWNAQDGTKRSKHTLVIDNFQFVGGKRDGDEMPGTQNPVRHQAPRQPASRQQTFGGPSSRPGLPDTGPVPRLAGSRATNPGPSFPDDEIPFAWEGRDTIPA